MFICPKCKSRLKQIDKSLICEKGHCYDISSKGYVNLLIHKSTLNPGDNKDMVEARFNAMQNGYYNALLSELKNIINQKNPKVVLDLGCGEGSLTTMLSSDRYTTVGIDISKYAINMAASRDKRSKYVVASINNIPVADKSVDVIINCFAPLDENEAKRILKDDGILIKITPAEKHLLELKNAIYPDVYLNKQKEAPKGFEILSSTIATDKIVLEGDFLESVVKMTPYFYKTQKELLDKALKQSILCSLEFCITVFK